MKLPRLNRLTVLLIAQGVVLAGVVIWGVHTWRQAQAEHDRFALPTHCPNGHTTLDLVKIRYGPVEGQDSALVLADDHVLQLAGGSHATPDSPAFIIRCSTCNWQTDGWTFATLKEALKDHPELAHLADP